MSHTTQCGSTTFVHDGDYGGDIRIVDTKGAVIEIPMVDLNEFITGSMRDHIIMEVEEMSGADIEALYVYLQILNKG